MVGRIGRKLELRTLYKVYMCEIDTKHNRNKFFNGWKEGSIGMCHRSLKT